MAGKLLLVEDDPISRDLIQTLCEGEGYDVDVAADGFAGLRLLQEAKHTVCLLDYHLPEIDGVSLARLIRQLCGREPPRIIGITADRSGLVARQGGRALFDAIVSKPFKPRHLFSTLTRPLLRESSADASLAADLAEAVRNEQFGIEYQPTVRAADGHVLGFEALLRWNHPVRGAIAPSLFVPLAESLGLIERLGEWILRCACREAARWPDPIWVAVNLSATQVHDPALIRKVAGALSASGLAPHRLELEVTEAVRLEESDPTLDVLGSLRSLGIRLVMDDFGAGFSSINYLRAFPFDKLKFDRSLTLDVGQASRCAAIIRAVTGMAAELGMSTTAEGIETSDQLRQVVECGCDNVQGFIFSRPVSSARARGMIAAGRRFALLG